jgi:hypothetical protein
VGYAANEIAARGAQSDRMEALQAILARNEIRLDVKDIERELRALEKEQAEQQRREELAKREAQKVAEAAKADLQKREGQAKAEAEKQKTAATKPKPKEKSARPPAERPHIEIQIGHAAAEAEAKKRPIERPPAAPPVQKEPAQRPSLPPLPRPIVAPKELAQAGKQTARAGTQLAGKGLQVADRATGTVMKLADFVLDFLSGSSEPAPAKTDMRAFLKDPAARKQQQLAELGAIQSEREDAAAIERIARDMQKGDRINAEDVRKLTYQHQQQIRTFGDTAMQQMVDEARKRGERYWKGEGRERE